VTRAAALTLALALASCAPSTKSLLSAHDYAEAICSTGRDPAAKELVLETMERDLATSVYVHALTPAELAPVFEGHEPKALFLRNLAFQKDASIGKAYVEIVPHEHGVPLGRLGTGFTALAQLTGERIPGSREVTTDTRTLEQRVREATLPFRELGAGAVWVVSLGLVKVDVDRSSGPGSVQTKVIDPTRTELEESAPRAMALADANVEAWEHPSSDDVSILVRLAYTTYGNQYGECVVSGEVTVPLPHDARTIEDRINAYLGDRYHPLTELRRAR
jgi:hypothetical protein